MCVGISMYIKTETIFLITFLTVHQHYLLIPVQPSNVSLREFFLLTANEYHLIHPSFNSGFNEYQLTFNALNDESSWKLRFARI